MNKMVAPVGHRVLIRLHDSKDRATLYKDGARLDRDGNLVSEFGIVLKTSIEMNEELKREQQGMETGEVIALGPTAYADFTGEPWVNVGDKVHFKRYEGVYLEIDDNHYRILNDEDIFAKENVE